MFTRTSALGKIFVIFSNLSSKVRWIAAKTVISTRRYFSKNSTAWGVLHKFALYLVAVIPGNIVLEFGGGYGSLCRGFHRCGFKGKYMIFYFPHFSTLQRFFLGSAGIMVHEDASRG